MALDVDVAKFTDIVDEECDMSVRAGVLLERLKAYEPELPKDIEPMVYVNATWVMGRQRNSILSFFYEIG
ncbi:MAG: hypothetical protein U0M62_03335 [Lachnospiraceae bacterium]